MAEPGEGYPIPRMLSAIARKISPWPRATLFELRARGHGDVYAQLVSCLISVRTLDEVSLPVSLRLLERAPSPEALLGISLPALTELLVPAMFPGQKARQLLGIAEVLVDRGLPRSYDELLALPGIGPKCANLVLGIALGVPSIGVDVHVFRVTNRWGLAAAPTPEKTEAQLRSRVPRRYWVQLNELLVPFGKHVCTGFRPRCSECPVLRWCEQVGVRNPR